MRGKSLVKHSVNGSEEPSSSNVNGEENSSFQEAKVNELSPGPPVNGVGKHPRRKCATLDQHPQANKPVIDSSAVI